MLGEPRTGFPDSYDSDQIRSSQWLPGATPDHRSGASSAPTAEDTALEVDRVPRN
jgi:hypothetical protein